MQFNLKQLLAVIVILLAGGFAWAESPNDWPRWRGPHDNGCCDLGAYPVKWDATTNLLWKAPLPGKGCSTPIVWDRRIFLTAPVDGHDAALAFDWSGKPLWQTTFGPERAGKNRNGSGANPSRPRMVKSSRCTSRAATSRYWISTVNSAGRPISRNDSARTP